MLSSLPLSLRQLLEPRIAGKAGDLGKVVDVAKVAAEETDRTRVDTIFTTGMGISVVTNS